MRFGELIKHTRPNLIVSQRHEAWLAENDSPVYTQEALDFAREQLTAVGNPVDRTGKISASSLNNCERQQMFTFLGMPEQRPTTQNAAQMSNGVFLHIRWQMAGLTAGWLDAAEVPIPVPNALRLRGTQDGVSGNTLVEFKSISPHGYASIAKFGVKDDHRFQVGAYMAATGRDRASVIYENKGNQEYVEYMVEMDDQLYDDIKTTSEIVWDYTEEKKLPEPLSKCIDKEGWEYRFCQFRNVCLGIHSWQQAEDVRDKSEDLPRGAH